MKPYWQLKHDWWCEDFSFEVKQKRELVLLLRRHPEDKMGSSFREMIKNIDKRITRLKREYKKIYGVNFNLNRIKQ